MPISLKMDSEIKKHLLCDSATDLPDIEKIAEEIVLVTQDTFAEAVTEDNIITIGRVKDGPPTVVAGFKTLSSSGMAKHLANQAGDIQFADSDFAYIMLESRRPALAFKVDKDYMLTPTEMQREMDRLSIGCADYYKANLYNDLFRFPIVRAEITWNTDGKVLYDMIADIITAHISIEDNDLSDTFVMSIALERKLASATYNDLLNTKVLTELKTTFPAINFVATRGINEKQTDPFLAWLFPNDPRVILSDITQGFSTEKIGKEGFTEIFGGRYIGYGTVTWYPEKILNLQINRA